MTSGTRKSNIFLSYARQFQQDAVQTLHEYMAWAKDHQWHIITEANTKNGNAIEKADLVVICYSRKYLEQMADEADYADRCQKAIFVVFMHPDSNDGLFSLILSRAKDAINLFDYQDVEDAAEVVTERVAKILGEPRFYLFNVPETPSWFHPRLKTLEEAMHSRVKRLRSGEVLLVSGVGKTTYLSTFLRSQSNQAKLIDKNRIKVVKWYNFFKWRDAECFTKNDLRTVSKILRQDVIAAKSDYLLVFDDVTHLVLIEALFNMAQSDRSKIVISTTENLVSLLKTDPRLLHLFQNNSGVHHLHLPAFSDQEIDAIIHDVLKSSGVTNVSISQPVFRVISVSCNGLPQGAIHFAELIADNFKKKQGDHAVLTMVKQHAPTMDVADNFQLIRRQSLVRNSSHDDKASLICVGVPNFDQYYRRKDEERKLVEGIKRLAGSPASKGTLLVGGCYGVGKTSLISATLLNHNYGEIFVKSCDIDVAIWLNCNKLETTDAIVTELIRKGRNMVLDGGQATKWATLMDMINYFDKKKKQRILFIFDEISNLLLLTALQQACESGLFLVIMSDDDSSMKISVEVGQMTDIQLVEMLQLNYGMKDKLSERQLLQLVSQFCRGSPLLAGLFVGFFYRCKSYQSRFNEIMQHQQLDFVSIIPVFTQIFETIYPYLTKAIFSFLLFSADHAVLIVDLAVLWSQTVENANIYVDSLESLSLIRRSNNGLCCNLHPQLYDATVEIAFRKYNVNKLDDLRLAIARNLLCSGDFIEFVFKMIEKDKFDLLCDIIEKIPESLSKAGVLSKINPPKKLKDSTNGRTCLMAAAKCGHLSLADILCEKSPDLVTMQDSNGHTAFCWAVLNGQFDMVEFLYKIKPGVIRHTDNHGRSIYISALQTRQNVKIVDFLLEKHPDFLKNLDYMNKISLMTAAQFSNRQTVELLYSKWPESLKMADKDGKTAIMYAAEGGNLEAVRFLHEIWPDGMEQLTYNGETVLMAASRSGNLDVVRYVFNAWPNGQHVKAKTGATALLETTDIEVSQFLYERFYEDGRISVEIKRTLAK